MFVSGISVLENANMIVPKKIGIESPINNITYPSELENLL